MKAEPKIYLSKRWNCRWARPNPATMGPRSISNLKARKYSTVMSKSGFSIVDLTKLRAAT